MAAEQLGEQQPLLNSNDEVESDHERPLHISQNEENNLTSIRHADDTESTPAILEDGKNYYTLLTCMLKLYCSWSGHCSSTSHVRDTRRVSPSLHTSYETI